MSFKSISIKNFRAEVDSIDEDFDRNLVKIAYLTAARASELCNKTSPYDLLNGKSRPYGQFMEYAFKDFEITPREDPSLTNTIIEKCFVITSAVAKRGKRIKKHEESDNQIEVTEDDIKQALTRYNQTRLLKKWEKNEIEIDPRLIQALQGKLVFKAIALPTTIEYEPWTYDLLKYYSKNRKLTFTHTRQYFNRVIRRALKNLLPPAHKKNPRNILRHWRLSHLVEYYQFDAVELSNISGWTMKTAYQMQGMTASSSIDYYIHLAWRQYFRKLMRPIEQFM